MIVFELSNPNEVKYGGTLIPSEQARCFRQTSLEGPQWVPYQRKFAQVENICGKLVSVVSHVEEISPAMSVEETTAVVPGSITSVTMEGESKGEQDSGFGFVLPNPAQNIDLKSVCFKTTSSFGQQFEFFHVNGHVTARCTPGLPKSVIFKGVRGVKGLNGIISDLILDKQTTRAQVHMGVIGSFMGVMLQTTQCCYLENKLTSGEPSKWLKVESRLMDQCNVVRLSVTKWDYHDPPLLPRILMPLTNDIVLTGRGSLMHRFTWPSRVWTEEVENIVLGACDRVAESIALLC